MDELRSFVISVPLSVVLNESPAAINACGVEFKN